MKEHKRNFLNSRVPVEPRAKFREKITRKSNGNKTKLPILIVRGKMVPWNFLSRENNYQRTAQRNMPKQNGLREICPKNKVSLEQL